MTKGQAYYMQSSRRNLALLKEGREIAQSNQLIYMHFSNLLQ